MKLEFLVIGFGNGYFYKGSLGSFYVWVSLGNIVLIYGVIL